MHITKRGSGQEMPLKNDTPFPVPELIRTQGLETAMQHNTAHRLIINTFITAGTANI